MERLLAARRRLGGSRGGVDRDAHTAHGVPIYGICYGNQIMAHALGGTVERAREPEIGWHQIVSDVPEVISEGPWMQWHYDVVTVPPGAEELARSAVGPQAWRWAAASARSSIRGDGDDDPTMGAKRRRRRRSC